MGKVKEYTGIIVLGALVIIGIALLYTLPVYFLWNWLMPKLFGLSRLTLLQALGLNLLAGFLFRGSCNCKK